MTKLMLAPCGSIGPNGTIDWTQFEEFPLATSFPDPVLITDSEWESVTTKATITGTCQFTDKGKELLANMADKVLRDVREKEDIFLSHLIRQIMPQCLSNDGIQAMWNQRGSITTERDITKSPYGHRWSRQDTFNDESVVITVWWDGRPAREIVRTFNGDGYLWEVAAE